MKNTYLECSRPKLYEKAYKEMPIFDAKQGVVSHPLDKKWLREEKLERIENPSDGVLYKILFKN